MNEQEIFCELLTHTFVPAFSGTHGIIQYSECNSMHLPRTILAHLNNTYVSPGAIPITIEVTEWNKESLTSCLDIT